ncbi:MAG: serine/threonine protein kinase [Deltaproteobacteria bacterium]|nr:serine/threonine protein kinase [Deltaproteobacteria bacterium]
MIAERYSAGTVVAGRFKIVKEVGAGGMGVVYEATQLSVNRSVALKIIGTDVSRIPNIVRRFRQEAEIVASLSHPNIVTLIDFGETESGDLFLAMELVRGLLLADRLALGKPIPPASAVSILAQILKALDHAHAKGIIHRDLKPSNVMLMETDDGGSLVKLLDFGIAKVLREPTSGPAVTATGVGLVVGTPFYVAPEQAAGGRADARSDIYSAGIMLYELLVGVPPFADDDSQEVLMRHLYENLPPLPKEIEKTVPDNLRDVMLRATMKRPSERFQSAREMRVALVGDTRTEVQSAARGEPLQVKKSVSRPATRNAGTPTAFETTAIRTKTTRLRPGAWVAIAAGILALGVTVSLFVTGRGTEDGRVGSAVETSSDVVPLPTPRVERPIVESADATRAGIPDAPQTREGAHPRVVEPPRVDSIMRTVVKAASDPRLRERVKRSEKKASARAVRLGASTSSLRPSVPATTAARRAAAKSEHRDEFGNSGTRLDAVPQPPPRVEALRATTAAELRVIVICRDTGKACWASISLNGRETQTSRVARFKPSDGTHTIRVDKEGYETAGRKVTLAGKSAEVTVHLERTP